MKDIIERKESCAESQYDKMYQGNGKLKCTCGNIFNEDEGTVISADPWGMPACPTCAEDYFIEYEQRNNRG